MKFRIQVKRGVFLQLDMYSEDIHIILIDPKNAKA